MREVDGQAVAELEAVDGLVDHRHVLGGFLGVDRGEASLDLRQRGTWLEWGSVSR